MDPEEIDFNLFIDLHPINYPSGLEHLSGYSMESIRDFFDWAFHNHLDFTKYCIKEARKIIDHAYFYRKARSTERYEIIQLLIDCDYDITFNNHEYIKSIVYDEDLEIFHIVKDMALSKIDYDELMAGLDDYRKLVEPEVNDIASVIDRMDL